MRSKVERVARVAVVLLAVAVLSTWGWRSVALYRHEAAGPNTKFEKNVALFDCIGRASRSLVAGLEQVRVEADNSNLLFQLATSVFGVVTLTDDVGAPALHGVAGPQPDGIDCGDWSVSLQPGG